MPKTSSVFSDAVCQCIRDAIRDAEGNEVFLTGVLDRNALVCDVRVASRGHESAVPVVPAALETAEVLIHNHPSGRLAPSEADLGIASRMAERGTGFYIVNNEVTEVYVVIEPVEKKERVLVDTDWLRHVLGESGPLAETSRYYEERPTQIELSCSIARAFNEGKIGVFEAGTGTGKSYAYLLPAMLWALHNKDRVVISTGTINLQQQLIEKDIPAAEALTGSPVKTILMKGRQNYVCRRRLAEALADRDLFDDEVAELETIAEWVARSPDGSRSDLSFMPKEQVWSRICSESDACMGIRCAFHEECFVMRVRKEAATSHIIIVNHHLLFADLEVRMGGVGYDDTAVLPPFHHIIFDEAHGIEDAATSFFSEYFTRFRMHKQVSVFYRIRRGSISGHLLTLERLSSSSGHVQDAVSAVQKIKDVFTRVEDIALSMLSDSTSWRLREATSVEASRLLEAMALLRAEIAGFTGIIREILDGIDEEDQNEPVVWESKFALRRLEFVGILCQHFIEWSERRESVFWMERLKTRDGSLYPRFVQTPLSVAPMMKEGVFEPFNTVLCVSATLRIGTSFGYWLKRNGVTLVEQDRVLTGVYDSPFPYDRNVLFCVPSDAPLPEEGSYQIWLEHAIVSLLQSSAGRALVLFTSYESLRTACSRAREALSPLGIQVYRQGDDDRSRLLEAFKNDESSVLFATDSFWAGVDAPGDTLSHVILAKLPFKVPNDPVHAARSEALEMAGLNPFMELSLPEAVVRFRQGFGRLIRRKTDRGVVTVLDRRLLTKTYGSLFTSSVPETRRLTEPLQDCLSHIETFLYN